MKNIADKLSDEQYETNFADISPAMSQTTATVEASRCLYCYDAPCTKACPTAIDVPAFIRKIHTRNVVGSAKVILEANVLGASCSRVCPVDVLCEGACVYNARHEKPIEIARLQRFATDWVLDRNITVLKAGPAKNGRAAIIGAGPAGLSCAAELAKAGYGAVVFEKRPQPGGLDTYGIASYKLRPEDSLREIEIVKRLGVEFRTGVEVGKDVLFTDLERDFEAIFVAVGLGPTQMLNIPGEDLDGVVDALEFIESFHVAPFREVPVGRRVAVIGAGNTAVDAATQAKRLGADEVTIVYRRSEHEMPAYAYEFQLAKNDGILFAWLTSPQRVLGDTEVSGLECVRMTLGDPDASGRRRPEVLPGSEFVMPVDMVIKSLGQTQMAALLAQIPGLKFSGGRVVADAVSHQTGNPHFFAGGDCVNGGKEVVDAVASGKRAAQGMIRYIYSH